MSKPDNANLRLLGFPINLTYRSKIKDGKKRLRDRPQSALTNFGFHADFTSGIPRPYSADTSNYQLPSRDYHHRITDGFDSPDCPVKVISLSNTSNNINNTAKETADKDINSNASDFGSENTYASLGTKIKVKAQSVLNNKFPGSRSHYTVNNTETIKNRNKIKKSRKITNLPFDNCYDLKIKIRDKTMERLNNNMEIKKSAEKRNVIYESYFLPLDTNINSLQCKDMLEGRVSFGADYFKSVESNTRSSPCKPQLSLVEEETTQCQDSVESQESQNMSSLSLEISTEDLKNNETLLTMQKKTSDSSNEPKSYDHFHNDFQSNDVGSRKRSSTGVSSKDSGFHDEGVVNLKQSEPVLHKTDILKSNSVSDIMKSKFKLVDGIDEFNNNTYPFDKKAWLEPTNHSRLLYKDFFLKKDDFTTKPPVNSPVAEDDYSNDETIVKNTDHYPSYLLHSNTKAFTSKVIEDYKKELEVIDNLHKLTLQDIKNEVETPKLTNLDDIFDQNLDKEETTVSSENYIKTLLLNTESLNDKSFENCSKQDVSKISTKDLIQNYLKVKSGVYNKSKIIKSLKSLDKNLNNINSNELKTPNDCKAISVAPQQKAKNIKRSKNTNHNYSDQSKPLSARIESVQNDKDIDSWMSLSAHFEKSSPTIRKDESSDSVVDTEIKCDNSEPTSKEPIQNLSEEQNFNESIKKTTPVPETTSQLTELKSNATVLDIYSMLKEIEKFGDEPVIDHDTTIVSQNSYKEIKEENPPLPKDNFMEIFEFLEKVEQSANDALSVVSSGTPQNIPKLEVLLKLPQTELAQRLVTASLQLEERSCCIALLQESLASHKQQMINKVSNLEKQSQRNISKVKQDCEDAIKRHQNFIDQLINDKKTLNHRIEQLVDERRSLEERWKRNAHTLEERYKLELRNQHDKMAAAQQVARQRWVRQKAEKIKELTVKGLEGELREMAERQQKEVADLKMSNAEQIARLQAQHSADMDHLRRTLEEEREVALARERQLASNRMEKQILDLELTYQEQRKRLVGDMRAENERMAAALAEKEHLLKDDIEKWRQDQEKVLDERRTKLEDEIRVERQKLEELLKLRREELEERFEQYKREFEAEQQILLKKKVTEISAQHKLERDREIEKAIESMEAEAHAGRKELQEALKRNKEQYEAELKELAETEQATLRRYQEAQARMRHSEDRVADLEVTVSQLETRNRLLTEKNSQLENSAKEIEARLGDLWRGKVEESKKEMEDLKRMHEEQMHQLYAKVKIAVARKDSALQALGREGTKLREKVALLEQKLQQQRKDFLKQK